MQQIKRIRGRTSKEVDTQQVLKMIVSILYISRCDKTENIITDRIRRPAIVVSSPKVKDIQYPYMKLEESQCVPGIISITVE